jgi:hypothetical protein
MFFAAAVTGCEFSETTPVDTGGGTMCDTAGECNGAANPLRTCNAKQDAYDCQILSLTMAAGEPDAMIFKAQVSLESNFEVISISHDMPCPIPSGWTLDESRSFGLMQLTPACGWLKKARLPNGHPNLERDDTSALWATSVFNPTLNVEEGVRAIQVARTSMKAKFTGCSVVEYTKMSLSAFNQGESSVTGCGTVSTAGTTYIRAVLARYEILARTAGYAYPY